ncbi:NAD(+) synthase [Fusibacter sp. JL298sf-3]
MKSVNEKIESTVNWMRAQVEASHTKGMLVGLSGGIDSAVVACLIKKAFPQHSLGVILPCKSNPKDAEDAKALAEACGIDYVTVDLSEEHSTLMGKVTTALQSTDKEMGNERLYDANLRARLRMTTLYGIANALGYLVAGTDNAAELYTGYFTKYGDGGVDLLPIAHLLKQDVFKWAEELDVPQQIIDRKPSAGLWDGQTDEDEMGTTYDRIDAFLCGEEVPEKDKAIIERLHRVSEHKRNMPPAPPAFE